MSFFFIRKFCVTFLYVSHKSMCAHQLFALLTSHLDYQVPKLKTKIIPQIFNMVIKDAFPPEYSQFRTNWTLWCAANSTLDVTQTKIYRFFLTRSTGDGLQSLQQQSATASQALISVVQEQVRLCYASGYMYPTDFWHIISYTFT